MPVEPGLATAASALLQHRRVLVGLDFDGVLAPIVQRRDDARPVAGAMDAVRRLAALPDVEVALVSGRSLDSLLAVSGVRDDDPISLVGSHGAEARLHAAVRQHQASLQAGEALTPEEDERLTRLVTELQGIVDAAGPGSGLDVETKPAGAVLHTRRAAPDVARQAEEAALAGPATWPGVHPTRGKAVIELAVTEATKGVALQHLRAATRADGVLYAGDDVTDETAFATLGAGDVGVKVGAGDSGAAYRLDGPADVAELLQLMVAARSGRSQR